MTTSRSTAAGPPAIVATDVSRTYDLDGVSVPALRGVSLTVADGDYLAIVGASGSGKSTLMHLLGGLDRPTGGTLLIGGRDVAKLSPPEMALLRNKTIGFVFQSFHLLARTTARDNVALPLVYRGIGRRERRARAAEMLARVGLAHRMDHRPNQMSGGEQQRVAIARALVTGPSVLLADEPTGNLDTTTGQSVLALLESLNAEGVAVVLVTHDRDVAARAHRQIVMRDGLIVEDSSAPTAAAGAPAGSGPAVAAPADGVVAGAPAGGGVVAGAPAAGAPAGGVAAGGVAAGGVAVDGPAGGGGA
ncbi:ABC transporter ATP-binding protein [Actinoplanes sp. NPDC049599]|uniref:ABC transporter ATP-binding protein n=1 Tax=Actinoplanes sp. NPDC049599 TaxID=3363903 RepID=UPI003797AFD3